MMFLTSFIGSIGFPKKVKLLLRKPSGYLFGIGPGGIEAITTGLSGGYNIAVRTAATLYELGNLSQSEARRIALHFMNPGIAFTINITGLALYGNIITGIRFYIISVAVCFLTAFISNRIKPAGYVNRNNSADIKISQIFTDSVSSASSAVISISFSIILFTAISEIIKSVLHNKFLGSIFILFSEVSSGIIYSTSNFASHITIFILVFSGFCIYIQNIKDLRKLSVKAKDYFAVRLIQSFLCGASEYIYCRLFPDALSAAAISVDLHLRKASPTGTAALILLCIILLNETRKMKTRQLNRRYQSLNYKKDFLQNT